MINYDIRDVYELEKELRDLKNKVEAVIIHANKMEMTISKKEANDMTKIYLSNIEEVLSNISHQAKTTESNIKEWKEQI